MMNFNYIDPLKIEKREYQFKDAEQLSVKLSKGMNCGLVYPTGIGKSYTMYPVADNFLAKGKVLINAHSNPLVDQHYCNIKKIFNLNEDEVAKLVGKVSAKKRAELWKNARLIVSTPQTIVSELKKGTIDLNGIALVVFDEMQMAKDKYAYVEIARRCRELGIPILGLTASTGGSKIISKDKIRLDVLDEIYKVDWWIYRPESDPEIKEYLFSKKEVKEIIEYPEKHKEAMRHLRRKIICVHDELARSGLIERLENTADLDRRFPFCQISELKRLRPRLKALANELRQRNKFKESYRINVLFDAYMKLMHLLNLFVTEGYEVSLDYLGELAVDLISGEYWRSAHPQLRYKNSVAYEILKRNDDIRAFYRLINGFIKNNVPHPKLKRLIALVKGHLKRNVLILVFCNYKKSIDYLKIALEKQGIKPEIIAGVKFMKIEDQRKILDCFKNREFSVLLATPVIEAGIHVPKIDLVINYSMPLTGIAQIQRGGRAGRTNFGLIYYLIMDNSNDTSLYFAARADNNGMDQELRRRLLIQEKEAKGENVFFLKAKQASLEFEPVSVDRPLIHQRLISKKNKIRKITGNQGNLFSK
ncbi:MAG: helicase-related protein [Parcubacteria group bacterium]